MANNEEQKRVGIWIRVSTEDQVRGESPETHERRARAYADAKGWEVVELYRLDAVSGKTVKEHPEAKRMLEDIRKGKITGLIFSKLARLARNTIELLEFAELFRQSNADLVSLGESIDTSTPAGRLFYTMISAMAQWEREEISARVAASVPIRAKMGKRLGGLAPFGYQWVDGKLIPHPEEAPIRVLMYELFREHKRLKTVARMLNERGYRSRKGTPFSDTVLAMHLLDPTAKGVRRANFSKQSKKGWVFKPESEWVFHEVPAIISVNLWNECHDFIMAKRASGKRVTRRAAHLFSGYVYCQCGKKMYVLYRTVKYCCRTCRNKIATDDLEAVFEQELLAFTLSPKEITAHVAKLKASLTEKETLVEVLAKEQKKVAAALETLYDLYQSQSIDKKSFSERHEKLATRRDQLENELPAAEGARDALKISVLSQEEVFSEAQTLFSRWKSLEEPAKRHIVETLVDRIIIHEGEVMINLTYAPPLPPSSGSNGSRDPIPAPKPNDLSIPSNFSLNDGKRASDPSGSLDPSADDLLTTRRLADAGRLLGIPLIDHLIVGEEGFTSLRESFPDYFELGKNESSNRPFPGKRGNRKSV